MVYGLLVLLSESIGCSTGTGLDCVDRLGNCLRRVSDYIEGYETF